MGAFRVNGHSGARWLADQIGDREIEESTENTSFGANDVRDSTSINRASDEGNLVLKSEIQELNDNECFLCLKRGLPVAKIKSPFVKLPTLHPGILENDFFSQQENQRAFKIENDKTPEQILEAINRSVKATEQSKFVEKNELNPAAAKSMSQVIDDIRREKQISTDGNAENKVTTNQGQDETGGDNSESEDALLESFAPLDLSALAMEREDEGIEDKKDETNKTNEATLKATLDPYSNYTFR